MKKPRFSKSSGNVSKKHRIMTKNTTNGVEECLSNKPNLSGKRLVSKPGDLVKVREIAMRDSTRSKLGDLALKHQWSAGVFIDKLINGDDEAIQAVMDINEPRR